MQDQTKRLEVTLEEMNQQHVTLKEECDAKKARLQVLEKEIDSKTQQHQKLTEAVGETQGSLAEMETEISRRKGTVTEMKVRQLKGRRARRQGLCACVGVRHGCATCGCECVGGWVGGWVTRSRHSVCACLLGPVLVCNRVVVAVGGGVCSCLCALMAVRHARVTDSGASPPPPTPPPPDWKPRPQASRRH